MNKYKNKKQKDNLNTCNAELEHLMEQLMGGLDFVPCEAGIYCPFFLDNPNEEVYCYSGNCVRGMALYAHELCAKTQIDN